MTTILIILGGFALLVLLFLFVSWRFRHRDYGEDLDYGDDIYGPSLMDVEDCKREGEKKCDDHR